MSTLPALIEAFAPHDGRSVAALRAVATALREGGLVASGARGNGAIRMGPDDAAAIVLAALWTDSPIASPRAVEVLSSLKRKPAPPVPVGRFADAIVRLPNLGETVASLIEHGRYIQAELTGFDLELTVSRPVPTAALALVDELGRRRVIAEWSVDAAKLTRGFYRVERLQGADRRHSSTITGQTLFSLSDCIAAPDRERV